MNLIETYVAEVGRHLPQKTRGDIEAELRSILEDMLEERGKQTGKPVDEELTLEVLKNYGAPDKVAASYMPERYLIGPRLFPVFLKVLSIVFPIIVTLAAIGGFMGVFRSVASVEDAVGVIVNVFVGVMTSAISALGNLVLIFAAIEWVMRQESPQAKRAREKEWDPRSLRKVSAPDRVRVGERIADIVFNFAAIVLFNFYPQAIGFTSSLNRAFENGDWSSLTFFPIFTDLFFSRFVPWLTLVWVLDILINVVVLRLGSWKAVTRLASIAVRTGVIAIGAWMLATPGLLNITAEAIRASGPLGIDTAELLATMARQGFASVLVIVMILEGVEIVKHIYRLIRASF